MQCARRDSFGELFDVLWFGQEFSTQILNRSLSSLQDRQTEDEAVDEGILPVSVGVGGFNS